MTPRQRTALRYPCGRAPEILNPGFWRTEKAGVRYLVIHDVRATGRVVVVRCG